MSWWGIAILWSASAGSIVLKLASFEAGFVQVGGVALALAFATRAFLRRLPVQNIVAACCILGALGWAASFAVHHFAVLSKSSASLVRGDRHTSFFVLDWVAIGLNARLFAEAALDARRGAGWYGFLLLVVSSSIAASTAVVCRYSMAFQLVETMGLRTFLEAGMAFFVLAMVSLIAIAPWMIDKRGFKAG